MKVSLPDFSQARVLVIGDIMLDRYWHGPTSRISPEAPVPVVKVTQNEERPGGAANVALNVTSLGGKTLLMGLVGEDEPAQVLEKQLTSIGVDCHLQAVSDYPTITKLRVMSRDQQLIRLDFEERFHDVDVQPMLEQLRNLLSDVDVVILSDYDKGALAQVREMLAVVKQAGLPVLVDPKGSDFNKYRGATLMTPNLSEFEAIVGPCANEAQLVSRGHALRAELELDALLVTRGKQGMTLIRQDEKELHLPALAREVYDVTGAGDTVISVLATALAAGAPMDQACALANAAASVVVAKLGTSTVSSMELAQAISGGQESGFGTLTEQQLQFAVEASRKRGERIVMTNGCFDILHAGHVAYLTEAKALGDRLIVAVNDDASVRRLKGEGRPVNPLDRRMAVLAGLGAVDWVVPFSEDTPARVIAELLPDVLVKGGDYKADEIAGADAVWKNGGEVQILQFKDGCSTTQIIQAIQDKG